MLIPLVDRGGPKLAMGTLMQVANGDRDVRGFGHVYAHAIGIHAFDVDKNVERTFSSCTDAFQSGCYHGVIEAYFANSGKVDSQSVRGALRAVVAAAACTGGCASSARTGSDTGSRCTTSTTS